MLKRYTPLVVDTTLKSMLDYIFKFWNAPAPENKLRIENFLHTILTQFFIAELTYDNPVSAYVMTDHYSPATRKIFWYAESQRYKKFSLSEMAQTLGYNKHYLCSAFSQDTGLTILEYVNFIKIRQAMVHFFYWGTSLAEVCELLSFDSSAYFSTLFKSVVGISPGRFRKACLALSAEERTKINANTRLFTAGQIPLDDMFTSMKQLVASIMKTAL
jgi:AraC-like DNA-binding protein